eukprot:12617335-Alexandrium_andersonii.AAC.1
MPLPLKARDPRHRFNRLNRQGCDAATTPTALRRLSGGSPEALWQVSGSSPEALRRLSGGRMPSGG